MEQEETTVQQQPTGIAGVLAQEDTNAAITQLKSNRGSSQPDVAKIKAQLDPQKHDVMNPAKRKDRWVKVDANDPNNGGTGSDDGVRVTTSMSQDGTQLRKEPVERVAIALQKLIVKRAVAFLFGNKVLLDADPENAQEEQALKSLKKILKKAKTQTLNRRIARAVFSCTEAAEYWYPVPQPGNSLYGFNSDFKLRCSIFSPLKGDELYPYFDETGDMVAFSRQFTVTDASGTERTYFETYTAEMTYRWENGSGGWKLCEGYPTKNPIGKIPIIYVKQEDTEWADVQALIDRLEKLLSNFADTNDYHASPKIVTKGDIINFAKKGEAGAIIEMSPDGDAHYLTWDKAPDSVKLEIETLLRLIYTITQTPDISWESVKGLNVSGVALRLLFLDAHLKVEDKMEVFGDFLSRRYAVLLEYLAQMNAGNKDFADACRTVNVEPIVTPYTLEDEKEKVEILMAATGQKAISSRKKAVERLGWTDDVTGEIDAIEEEEEMASYGSVTEPTI